MFMKGYSFIGEVNVLFIKSEVFVFSTFIGDDQYFMLLIVLANAVSFKDFFSGVMHYSANLLDLLVSDYFFLVEYALTFKL